MPSDAIGAPRILAALQRWNAGEEHRQCEGVDHAIARPHAAAPANAQHELSPQFVEIAARQRIGLRIARGAGSRRHRDEIPQRHGQGIVEEAIDVVVAGVHGFAVGLLGERRQRARPLLEALDVGTTPHAIGLELRGEVRCVREQFVDAPLQAFELDGAHPLAAEQRLHQHIPVRA
jgi:hypothetical protein